MEYKIKEESGKIKVSLIENNMEVSKATCYYENTPKIDGKNIGTIGELEIQNEELGINLLKKCEEILKKKGVNYITAPMNGNTWKQYRTLKYTNGEPFFILENVNKMEDNETLIKAGYEEIYTYTSTKGLIENCYDSEILNVLEQKLEKEKITIRKFNKQNYIEDLKKIYNISVNSFYRNPMYTKIEETDFINQYVKYIQMIDEDYILIVEQNDKEIGFIFCIPDLNEIKKIGKVSTLVLKTIAILPEYEKYAIGNILLRKIAKKAKEKGLENWIFAFMYSNNTSQKIAKRNKTEIIREYALYGKEV